MVKPSRFGSLLKSIILPALLSCSVFAGGAERFDCSVFLNGASKCFYTVFPQVAVGGDFTSEIYVVNQGYERDEMVRLDFFDDSGAPLVLQTDAG